MFSINLLRPCAAKGNTVHLTLWQQELLSIVHNGSILLLFNEGDIMQVNFTKYRLFNLTTRLFLNARLNERQKNAKIAKWSRAVETKQNTFESLHLFYKHCLFVFHCAQYLSKSIAESATWLANLRSYTFVVDVNNTHQLKIGALCFYSQKVSNTHPVDESLTRIVNIRKLLPHMNSPHTTERHLGQTFA